MAYLSLPSSCKWCCCQAACDVFQKKHEFVNDHPVHLVTAIPQARMAYMSRVRRAIRVPPFEMLVHGCSPKLAVPAAFAMGSLAICEEFDAAE
jgi:hypothetical protein